jgi:hypothetical protein|nr:MAG TPA: hypothetical protein [Caudoviricetes sp.]
MDEFLKMLIEVAKESGADVHVHKFERKGSDNERTEQNEHRKCGGHCPDADMVKDAENVAMMNKVLFDAHIRAGFTEEQAIQIVAAFNS